METKKTTILIGFFWLQLSAVLACSCEDLNFCEYIKEETTITAFQAKVIAHKEYSLGNLAIYLEIIKKYKDEVGVTDTIKLYGREIEAGCAIDVHKHSVGDTLIMAIGPTSNSFNIVNPDSLSENYWEYYPSLCRTISMSVRDEKIIGRITEEIIEYPLSWFEEELNGCRFSVEKLEDLKCSEDNFIVFPNPSTTGKVMIKGEFKWNRFQEIRVFSADGRLLDERKDIRGNPFGVIELEIFQDGLIIMEITCDGRKYYKKVIIEK